MGLDGGVPAIDLHDLSVPLAVAATEAATDLDLDAGEVLLITGRGKRAGGISPLRDAVLRSSGGAPDGPGRVRVVLDPAKAARRGMGLMFWLFVALLAIAVLALFL